MNPQQTATLPETPQVESQEIVAQSGPGAPLQPHVDLAYGMYIEYVAVGGIRVEEDGTVERISMQQFCDTWHVDRVTIWRRRKADPTFQSQVDAKRMQIYGADRLNLVWRGLFLKAMKGDPAAAEMVLSHFSDYVPPTKKVEIKATGLADVLQLMRKRQQIVNGEVVAEITEGT